MTETNPPQSEDKEPAAQATAAKPAAAKKPKEPAIEDKPLSEFMEQHFSPALKEALAGKGIQDLELRFAKEKLPLAGTTESCWQLRGSWQKGQRQFSLYFLDENISGKKAFSCATNGNRPSTIESFMIDERKTNLDSLLLYTLQRLNGQKWLGRN